MSRSIRVSLAATLLALGACAHAPATGTGDYTVRANYPLAGPGRWDLLAVDPGRHHLFITRSDHVQVMDTRSGELLATIDVLASPASDTPAWPITHQLQVGPLADYHRAWGAAQPRSAQFMMPMDLAGVPAICVPCGFSADGLPYSLQLTGRRLSEAMLCRVAFAYEQATDWRRRHPSVHA